MKKKSFISQLRKVKFENIFTIMYIILASYQTYYHITLNGLYIGLLGEIIIHISFLIVFRYVIKDMRKDPENWF